MHSFSFVLLRIIYQHGKRCFYAVYYTKGIIYETVYYTNSILYKLYNIQAVYYTKWYIILTV